MPFLSQVLSKVREIVDFAVENDAFRVILIKDRLMPSIKVNDTEPVMPQPNMIIDIETHIVRPPVFESSGISSDFLFGCAGPNDAKKAAHIWLGLNLKTIIPLH